jgi:hypothetical protein
MALTKVTNGMTKSTYGAITLSPSDPWQDVFETATDKSVITLTAGTYTISGRLSPASTRLTLQAASGLSQSDVVIQGAYDLKQGTGIRFVGMTVRSPVSDIHFRAQNAYLDFDQCVIDGAPCVGFPMGVITGTEVRFTSRATQTHLIIGTNQTDGIDLDSNSNLKIVGNQSGGTPLLVSINFGSNTSKTAFTLDQTNAIIDGMVVEGFGTGIGGIGINARRGSDVTWLNGINAGSAENLTSALDLRFGSRATVNGLALQNNNRGIRRLEGAGALTLGSGVTFSGNNVDVDRSEALYTLDPYYGLSPVIVGLSTGGATVPAGTTQFVGFGVMDTGEGIARFQCPFDCTVKNLRVHFSSSPSAGENFVVTLRTSSADRPVTVTIADTANTGNDLVNIFDVTAGTVMCLKVVASAGATPRAMSATMELYARE